MSVPYVGTEINKAVKGPIPFVLIIANPHDKLSIMRYFSIGKMIYKEFHDKYDFCILNSTVDENKEYVEFFRAEELPAVYIVIPSENSYGRVNKKYHNSSDMRRILNNMLDMANK